MLSFDFTFSSVSPGHSLSSSWPRLGRSVSYSSIGEAVSCTDRLAAPRQQQAVANTSYATNARSQDALSDFQARRLQRRLDELEVSLYPIQNADCRLENEPH